MPFPLSVQRAVVGRLKRVCRSESVGKMASIHDFAFVYDHHTEGRLKLRSDKIWRIIEEEGKKVRRSYVLDDLGTNAWFAIVCKGYLHTISLLEIAKSPEELSKKIQLVSPVNPKTLRAPRLELNEVKKQSRGKGQPAKPVEKVSVSNGDQQVQHTAAEANVSNVIHMPDPIDGVNILKESEPATDGAVSVSNGDQQGQQTAAKANVSNVIRMPDPIDGVNILKESEPATDGAVSVSNGDQQVQQTAAEANVSNVIRMPDPIDGVNILKESEPATDGAVKNVMPLAVLNDGAKIEEGTEELALNYVETHYSQYVEPQSGRRFCFTNDEMMKILEENKRLKAENSILVNNSVQLTQAVAEINATLKSMNKEKGIATLKFAVPLEEAYLGLALKEEEIYVGNGRTVLKTDVLRIEREVMLFSQRAERLFELVSGDSLDLYRVSSKSYKAFEDKDLEVVECLASLMYYPDGFRVTPKAMKDFKTKQPFEVERRLKKKRKSDGKDSEAGPSAKKP